MHKTFAVAVAAARSKLRQMWPSFDEMLTAPAPSALAPMPLPKKDIVESHFNIVRDDH